MNILFISERLIWKGTGAEIVTKNNLNSIIDIFGENNVDIITFKSTDFPGVTLEYNNLLELDTYTSKIKKVFNWISLNNGGINNHNMDVILEKIKNNNYEFVFLDSSLYGKLAYKIKQINEDIKIIVFFHDVTKFWSKSLIKTTNGILQKLKLYLHHPSFVYNEYKSIQFADKIIALNSRDSKLIEREYNRKVNDIIPINIKDKFNYNRLCTNNVEKNIEILFVGAYYLPNISGIKWFIDNVLPNINAKLTIVGKGMDNLKNDINNDNVQIHGYVDDLADFYYRSDLVIAPIFDGGGMKVKVAEALMYGKYIIGTSEAFEGYDVDYKKIGDKCDDENSFIKSINEYINNNDLEKFNKFSRQYFLKKYEYESCLKKMKNIFN